MADRCFNRASTPEFYLGFALLMRCGTLFGNIRYYNFCPPYAASAAKAAITKGTFRPLACYRLHSPGEGKRLLDRLASPEEPEARATELLLSRPAPQLRKLAGQFGLLALRNPETAGARRSQDHHALRPSGYRFSGESSGFRQCCARPKFFAKNSKMH